MLESARPGWRVSPARRLAVSVAVIGVSALLAGCSDPGEAYIEMQNSIQSTLTSEHMPVSSVACTPHVSDLAWTDPPAHLQCVIQFKDGTSYSTPATVQPVVDQPDALSWNGPPDGRGVIDITKEPLPVPTTSLVATDPYSLFEARNLRPVVRELEGHFRGQSVVQLAIYPGELQAVIIDRANKARLVTVGPGQAPRVGPAHSVQGSRQAIYPNQINPAAVQALAGRISRRGGVPLSRLARFVLTLHGQDAGWDIYPVSGRIRFDALLQGQSLSVITAKGTRPLR